MRQIDEVFDEELRTAWAKLDEAKQETLKERYFEARKGYLQRAGEQEEAAQKQAREEAEALPKATTCRTSSSPAPAWTGWSWR